MSRKPYNHRARLERYYRAMLRSNHVAVIDIDASELQTLINWKNATAITSNSRSAVVDAITDIPHRWCIYLAALCSDQHGQHYMKSTEVAPQGIYLVSQLRDVIETYIIQLRDGCNPNHLHGMGWIAIPDTITLDETRAARLFETFGAWPKQEAA